MKSMISEVSKKICWLLGDRNNIPRCKIQNKLYFLVSLALRLFLGFLLLGESFYVRKKITNMCRKMFEAEQSLRGYLFFYKGRERNNIVSRVPFRSGI